MATALWMATLHQVMKGTLTKPPPAPTRPERKPMVVPAPIWPAVPGRVRVGLGFLSISICVAEKLTKAANTSASHEPLSIENTPRLASAAPSTMPGARRLTMSQRTAPRWWCARTLEMEVKMMVAMEVAMAILIDRSGATPRPERITVMKGTMIMPPPMPSRPARKPVHRPRATSSAMSRGSRIMRGSGPNAESTRRRGSHPDQPWNRLRRATGCVPPPAGEGGRREAAQGGVSNKVSAMPPDRHPEPGFRWARAA